MIGFVVGLIERAKGEEWEDITDAALSIGILYLILSVPLTVITEAGMTLKFSFLQTPIRITGLFTNLIGNVALRFLIVLGISFVAGLIETGIGAIFYDFIKDIQKTI